MRPKKVVFVMIKVFLFIGFLSATSSLANAYQEFRPGQSAVVCGSGTGLDFAVGNLNSKLLDFTVTVVISASPDAKEVFGLVKAPFHVSAPTVEYRLQYGSYDACVTITKD